MKVPLTRSDQMTQEQIDKANEMHQHLSDVLNREVRRMQGEDFAIEPLALALGHMAGGLISLIPPEHRRQAASHVLRAFGKAAGATLRVGTVGPEGVELIDPADYNS